MRATRAYIASLGTTGILLAASVAMLVVVSALVAFNGWGGGNIADEVERLFVADDRPELPVSGPAQAALDAAPAALAVAGRPIPTGPRVPRAGEREISGTLPVRREGTTHNREGTGDGESGGGHTGLIPVPPGTVPEVDPDKTVDSVSRTVRDTTKSVGDAVSPLSPSIGQAVTETGQALSELVDTLPATGQKLDVTATLP